jgi:hypothetical protein
VFGHGDAVLYRELSDDAVMTAVPMRIISDTPRRSVLYLAPGTAFRGARTPGGGPVRDLIDWISTDVVWTGVAVGHIPAAVSELVLADAERMTRDVSAAAPPFRGTPLADVASSGALDRAHPPCRLGPVQRLTPIRLRARRGCRPHPEPGGRYLL